MAQRKLQYKPLLFTTTVRNPSRVKSLLYVLKAFDGEILTNTLCEKIMGELIRHGLYRPMKEILPSIQDKYKGTPRGGFANLLLSDNEVFHLLKANPQHHKEAGFDAGWASRFATVFDFAKELGFVYFWQNEVIQFSQIGLKLANVLELSFEENQVLVLEKNPTFEQQAFLHSFSKYQRKNPFVRVLNDNIPLILLIQTIQKLNNDERFNNAGILKTELPLIIFWKNNNAQELYERIVQLRKEHKYQPSWEVIVDICENEIMGGDFKKFKPNSIMVEYPDEFIRKMRLTGLISLRGGGRFIDINKKELSTIEYLLNTYSHYSLYETEKDYFNYMAKVDENLISFETQHSSRSENRSFLEKWVAHYSFDIIKKELLILSKKGLSKDGILKYLTNPTRLEFLTALAIKSKLPNTNVIPNYPCDDEGIPTSTAGGQGNQGDIECFEGEKGILVEVTMSEGRTQTMMEIWPITRHLETFAKKANTSICYFIAPSIYPDSQDQIEWVKEKKNAYIVPQTIETFIKHLEKNEQLYTSDIVL